MEKSLRVLRRRIRADHRAVETVSWLWAARLRSTAEKCGSEEAATLADAVEEALARDGADGLVDLALAGPAIGGFDDPDVATLVGLVDERLAGHALAA